MGNILELKENGKVLATTSFEIIDIKSSVWLDSLDKEQKKEDGHTKTAFYGEELKLAIEVEGIDDGTELEIEIIAKNDEGTIIALEEDERQPLTLVAKATANKVIFEPFYLNPKWFNKDAPITYFFNLKIKGESTYIGKNLPSEIENQLKPIGFGKPDEFKIDKAKGYLLVKQTNGTKIAYTSGERLDIETYQDWFENESEELDFANKKQIDSYFKSVYGVKPYGWAPKGEFGGKKNRQSIIDNFELAGSKYGISPSILYTTAVGEGLIHIYKQMNNNFTIPVNSFQAFGLDFFGHSQTLKELYNGKYLDRTYKSGGIAKTGLEDIFYTEKFPSTAKFIDLLEKDGSVCLREEAGGPTEIYPVWFKDIEQAIIGITAVYAKGYDDASNTSSSLGWKPLNQNQNVYYGYFKVQYPNRELTHYGHNSENFLKGGENDSWAVPTKAYNRWVTWRYIKLSNYFTD